MKSFVSDGTYEVKGRGLVFTTNFDEDYYEDDLNGLLGCEVLIDGIVRKVVGVEKFMHCPPWRKGEACGLLVSD